MVVFQDLPSTSTPINATNLNNNFTECNNIVASGANTNGYYVKYSDGTMICNKTKTGTADIATAWGSLYTSAGINLGDFAMPFVVKPTIVVNPQNQSGTQFFMTGQSGGGFGSATNAGEVCLVRPNSRTNVAYVLDVVAVGRWKN